MTDDTSNAAKPRSTTAAKTRTASVQNEGDAPVVGTASALDNSAPAGIDPASEFSPSGAPRQVTGIDVDHPAVDNDPRAGTTVNQNRIDFNDPSLSGADQVAVNLGMKTEEEAREDAERTAKKD